MSSEHETGDSQGLRTQGLSVMRKVMPGVLPEGDFEMRDGGFADDLLEIGLIGVWGQLWAREGLSLRDRSLVTLALLVAKNAETELRSHVKFALTNGVTKTEIAELIYHSAGYVGFPAAVAARAAAREALSAEAGSSVDEGRK